jgi:hypothetical protein
MKRQKQVLFLSNAYLNSIKTIFLCFVHNLHPDLSSASCMCATRRFPKHYVFVVSRYRFCFWQQFSKLYFLENNFMHILYPFCGFTRKMHVLVGSKTGLFAFNFEEVLYFIVHKVADHGIGSEVFKWHFRLKIFNIQDTIRVWRARTPAGVRCAHFPCDITTIRTKSYGWMRWLLVSWTNVNRTYGAERWWEGGKISGGILRGVINTRIPT